MARLGDVCTIYSGTGFPVQYQGTVEGQYPFYKVGDIAKNVTAGNKYLAFCDNYVEADVVKKIKGTVLPSRTVVFAKIGEAVKLNRRAITSCECLIDNNAMGIAPNESVLTLDYFFHYMCSLRLETLAEATTVPSVKKSLIKKLDIPLPSLSEQEKISTMLNKISELIALRKEQLTKLDQLVKSRFIELFGDPITNSNNLPTERMELRFNLKAGITTAADDIHEFEEGMYEIPCYGGNGIRGYVREKSYTGNYPIIGRQGALCGNVQYATGEFHATEHAVLVSLLKNDNSVWVYHLLKLMDLFRYHTGAAQPGLAVKTLNTVEVIVADKSTQDQFAAFVEQTNKSKLAIQQSLDKLELLKKALMQEYFG